MIFCHATDGPGGPPAYAKIGSPDTMPLSGHAPAFLPRAAVFQKNGTGTRRTNQSSLSRPEPVAVTVAATRPHPIGRGWDIAPRASLPGRAVKENFPLGEPSKPAAAGALFPHRPTPCRSPASLRGGARSYTPDPPRVNTFFQIFFPQSPPSDTTRWFPISRNGKIFLPEIRKFLRSERNPGCTRGLRHRFPMPPACRDSCAADHLLDS